LLLIFITRTSFSSSQQSISETYLSNSTSPIQDPKSTTPCPSLPLTQTCTKTPPSLANALIHYATTNITPQQTFKEISVSARILAKKSPCNFLVFGLGHDSLMWTSLNHGGRTVFLEEDKSWIEEIQQRLPTLESYHVVYDTKVHQADQLIQIGMGEDCKVVSDPRFSKCQLSLRLSK
jgi:glucuronoxylan 4-O-methyltransferase